MSKESMKQALEALEAHADTLLNSLSIVQARALYDALRKIFGG